MWTIKCDNSYLYKEELAEDGYVVLSPKVNKEVNKASSFTFTINPQHPMYNLIEELKSSIEIFKDDAVEPFFCGRVLNESTNWFNQKQFVCESELAFLNDSRQRPFSFPVEEGKTSIEEYLKFLIARHNSMVDESKQFEVGLVSVSDPNDYVSRSDAEYQSTWSLIDEGLLKSYGGYLVVRHDYENDVRYLDYLADFNTYGNQPIEFGLNLLDLNTDKVGNDIATAIIPLGVRNEETEERLTIIDEPDETTEDICKEEDYVYSIAAVEKYGWIFKTKSWEDVTIAGNLVTKAKAYLGETRKFEKTIQIKAADISGAGYDVMSFDVGMYIVAKSEPHRDAHQIDSTWFLIKQLSLDLFNPANSSISVGAVSQSFVDNSRTSQNAVKKEIYNDVRGAVSQQLVELQRNLSSALIQKSDEILSIVSDEYTLKSDSDQAVSSLTSMISQTADAWQLALTETVNNMEAGFSKIESYVRYVDGQLILGLKTNDEEFPGTFVVTANQISACWNGVPQSYWNRNEMLTPGQLTIPLGGTFKLGSFAFVPRSSGNVSMLWIGGDT